MQFDAPMQGGGSLKAADVEGHVLVLEPTEYVASMVTSFGEKDAIRVIAHDITTSETHNDVLLFGSALIGSLKGQIGKRVLGVMGKGTAKPGQSAPWILVDASGDANAVAAATAYLNASTAATITAPAAPAAPAAQQSTLDAALGNLAAAGLST